MKTHITIIGPGLIGGSIGLALKRSGPADLEVMGYARHSNTLRKAHQRGAIDKGALTAEAAVNAADMVIIATPVTSVREVLARIAEHLPPGCVISDTASTKECVMNWAEEYLPPTVSFVGGHPMAGKEQAGINAADANLFHKRTYCLVEGPRSTPEAISTVVKLVTRIGANPLFIDASEHDKLVAGVSHLPNLLSVALVTATTGNPCWPEMSKLAASSYRDLTRLASSDAKMLSDIFLTNQQNILLWIDTFINALTELRHLVNKGHTPELERTLSQAKQARQKWLDNG